MTSKYGETTKSLVSLNPVACPGRPYMSKSTLHPMELNINSHAFAEVASRRIANAFTSFFMMQSLSNPKIN